MEDGENLFLQGLLELCRRGDGAALGDALQQVCGGPDAHVRGDQELFEFFQERVVEFSSAGKKIVYVGGQNLTGSGKAPFSASRKNRHPLFSLLFHRRSLPGHRPYSIRPHLPQGSGFFRIRRAHPPVPVPVPVPAPGPCRRSPELALLSIFSLFFKPFESHGILSWAPMGENAPLVSVARIRHWPSAD